MLCKQAGKKAALVQLGTVCKQHLVASVSRLSCYLTKHLKESTP